MSPFLIIITGLIYAFVAIDQGFRGNIPIMLMYLGSVLGTIGVYMLVK
jgi:hypothetical protein